MSKVVYNACYGGYTLSDEAIAKLKELGVEGEASHGCFYDPILPRHDPRLVQVVEELGEKAASGRYAKLRIANLSGIRYRIDEYDGNESVVEPAEAEHEWITIK